ncbi:MAG: hypothetical protein P4N59_14965 [Negativicutes bacterium]|nr:hypothetical protein [Negativicutes bacterium]
MVTYNEQISAAEDLSVTQIFRLGWGIFSRHPILIVIASLLITVPPYFKDLLIDKQNLTLSSIGWFILYFVLYVLVSCALIQLLASIVHGETVKWSAIMSTVRTKSAAAAMTCSIAAVILLVAFLLVIIPGIIMGVFYLFALQAVILRDFRGMAALRYSKSLVEGHWWTVFGMLVLLTIARIAVEYIWGVLIVFIFPDNLLLLVPTAILDAAFEGFSQVVLLLLFLRLESIKSRAPAAAAPEPVTPGD